MKKHIFTALIAFFVFFSLIPLYNVSAKTENLYVVKDNFTNIDSVLVIRSNPLYQGEVWVVEYGIGCSSLWRYESFKRIIATYNVFLDGIGGKLLLPNTKQTCRIWDAETLNDAIDNNKLRDEDWSWLQNNGYLN